MTNSREISPSLLRERQMDGAFMPQVRIDVRQGRSAKSIRQLIHAVTQAVVTTLGAQPETVRVIVTEVPATHWANGDVTLAEKATQDREATA